MQQQQQQGMRVDITNSEPIFNEEGGPLFLQGQMLRRVSKFVTGTPEDVIVNIPVMYDPKTMRIVESTLPPELREELKDFYEESNEE